MNNGSITATAVKTEAKDPEHPHPEYRRNEQLHNGHSLTDQTRLFKDHRLKNEIGDLHEYAAYYQQKIERLLSVSDVAETDRTAAEAVEFFKAGCFPMPFNRNAAEHQVNLAVTHFSLYSFNARNHYGLGSLPGMMLVPLLASALQLTPDTKIEGAGILLSAEKVKVRLSESFTTAAAVHDYGQERQNSLWRIKLLSAALALNEQIYSADSREVLQTKMAIQTTLIADSTDSISHHSLPERYKAATQAEALEKMRLDITETVNAMTEKMLGVISELDKRHSLLKEKGKGDAANTAYHEGLGIARQVFQASTSLRHKKS